MCGAARSAAHGRDVINGMTSGFYDDGGPDVEMGEPTGWGDDRVATPEIQAARPVRSGAWVMDVVLEDGEVSHCGHIDERVVVPTCPHCQEDVEHVLHLRAGVRVAGCGTCVAYDRSGAKPVMAFVREIA